MNLEMDVRSDPRYTEAHEIYKERINGIPPRILKTVDLSPFQEFGSGIKRAWFLMLRYPEIYNEGTLRVGSLGRATDSGIFWELG